MISTEYGVAVHMRNVAHRRMTNVIELPGRRDSSALPRSFTDISPKSTHFPLKEDLLR